MNEPFLVSQKSRDFLKGLIETTNNIPKLIQRAFHHRKHPFWPSSPSL